MANRKLIAMIGKAYNSRVRDLKIMDLENAKLFFAQEGLSLEKKTSGNLWEVKNNCEKWASEASFSVRVQIISCRFS